MKACPRCNTAAPIHAEICAKCGRMYRTKFVPEDQTRLLSSTLESLTTTSQSAPLQPVSPNSVIPASPHVLPVALSGIAQGYSEVQARSILLECNRQYNLLTWQRIAAFCLFPLMIGIIIYFYLRGQDLSLRNKVAALGIDAQEWEMQQGPRRMKTIGIFFGIVLILLLTIAGFNRAFHRPTEMDAHNLIIGMSAGQVRASMNAPQEIRQRLSDSNEDGIWIYHLTDGNICHVGIAHDTVYAITLWSPQNEMIDYVGSPL